MCRHFCHSSSVSKEVKLELISVVVVGVVVKTTCSVVCCSVSNSSCSFCGRHIGKKL